MEEKDIKHQEENLDPAMSEEMAKGAAAFGEEIEKKAGSRSEEAEEETLEEVPTEHLEEEAGAGEEGAKTREADPRDSQIAGLQDKILRNMAEFENFRNRSEKEKAAMFNLGVKSLAEKLLPVIDNFERAIAAAPPEENQAFIEGFKMIYTQLLKNLEEAGITPIDCVGKPFDPEYHNAVMHVEDDNFGENEVVEEFQKGYMLHEGVLRHSMVKVAN